MNPLIAIVLVCTLGCHTTPTPEPAPSNPSQAATSDTVTGDTATGDVGTEPIPPSTGPLVIDTLDQPRSTRAPRAPGMQRELDDPPPENGALARDGAIADRFVAEGQAVDYAFESNKGELSLFELSTMGFARGWESAATLQVLSEDGGLLSSAFRDGGSVYWMFQPFVAPATGRYILRLIASRECYRYVLVRHSGYRDHQPDDVLLTHDQETVYGYLSNVDDRVTYAIPVADGETIGVQVVPTNEPDRKRLRAQRSKRLKAELAAASSGDGEATMSARSMRASRAGASRSQARPLTQPDLIVTTTLRPDHALDHTFRPSTESTSHYLEATGNSQVVPTLETSYPTQVLIQVAAAGGRDGGLFELRIERARQMSTITGFVDNPDGDPAPGVTLSFLREPELDPVDTVTTSSDGSYSLLVPAGDYTIVVRDDGPLPAQTTHAGLDTDQELNLIYP